MTAAELQHLAQQHPVADQYDGIASSQDAYEAGFRKALRLISEQGDYLVVNGQLLGEERLMQALVSG